MKIFNAFLSLLLLLVLALASVSAEPYYSTKEAYEARTPDVRQYLEHSPAQLKGSSSNAAAQAAFDYEATFSSASPWLSGVNTGGVMFGGSILIGGFWGTSLTENDFVPVEIIFSTTDSTLCQTFQRDPSPNYASAGVGVFPGTAWDVSNPMSPRRLNICFVESSTQGTSNFIWDPNSASAGKREYLYIMNSDYDGTGTTYAGNNLYFGGNSMDVLYSFWPRVATGFSLLSTLPAVLSIEVFTVRNLRGLPDAGEITVDWVWDDADPSGFKVYGGTSPDPATVISTEAGSSRSFTHMGLVDGVDYYYKVEAVNITEDVIGKSKEINLKAGSVSSNMTIVGVWNGRDTYGDCWGYYDPVTEKEYALICARNEGVSIIDIDVSPPVEVGFIPSPLPGTDSKDVKIYQNYAIVVNEGDVVQIVDISDVTAPNQVSTFTPDGGGSHNCLVEGDYLYVIGNHGTGGLEIVDISNPLAPNEVGQFQPYYYHDIDIRNDTICATGIYGDGIDLIDVSNKAAPSLVTTFNYTGSGAHNAEFSFDGKYVFTGDEIGSSGNHTRVWDITNPLSVSLETDIIVDPSAVVHNCYVAYDSLLVLGHYSEGVRIWNVADPTAPFEVAYYDTYLPAVFGYVGVWSVYPYFASGRIIASDMQTGLYVFETSVFPTVSSGCCIVSRGNANSDPGDQANIADITFLVNWLFGIPSGPVPACTEEANANSDPLEQANIADITFLVNWLFGIPSGPPPAACP